MTSTRKNKKLNVVRYCRISADPTAKEAGVTRQQKDTGKIASDNDWTISHSYIDNDRSASRNARKEREQWLAMLEAVERGEIDVIIAYNLDRMVRQPKELERLIDLADAGKVRVFSATGEVRLDTAGGRMIARVLTAVAAHEAERTSERLTDKWRHDAVAGTPHWCRRPFGYTMDAKVKHSEQKVVEQMYEMIVAGETPYAVREWLNQNGHKTTLDGEWGTANIVKFIKSPRNIGRREYKGELMEKCGWKPLVDDELWRKASAALDARTNRRYHGGRVALLTGLMRCEHGHPMVRSSSGAGNDNRPQYRCSHRTLHGERCAITANGVHVDAIVEAKVLDFLAGAVTVPTKANKKMSTTVDDVNEINNDLLVISELLGKGQMKMPEFLAAKAGLDARLAEAERALAHQDASFAVGDLIGDRRTLAERWDTPEMTQDIKRRIIMSVVDRVEVKAVTRKMGRHFDRSRVEVIWRQPVKAQQ